MFKLLGTLGKGLATFTGLAAVIAGQVAGQGTSDLIVGAGNSLGTILGGLGGLLVAFGIGRKAGMAGHDTLRARGKIK